jgi:hypothetical protein
VKAAGAPAGPAASTSRRSPRAPSEIAGARVLATTVEVADAKALLEVVDRLKGRSAPPRSCSARPPTAACTWSRASRPSWSRGA